jgi:hypothetical protein
MASNIKHTQLTKVAYTYQDYVCIQMLVEWFHNPDKYPWDDKIGKLQAS